jgi:MFS family permease
MMKSWKTFLLSALGSGLEYYDFVTYIMLASVLSEVFFSRLNSHYAFISTLAIFASAYLVRPLGGILFAHFADRYGRKRSFSYSILLMAVATLLIGCLPSYQAAGVISPLLLIVLRLLQGLSQGAEIPGAITFLCEHADENKRGRNMGLLMSGVTIGAILSTYINMRLSICYSTGQIIQYAWRYPFILGGVLALIGFFIRRFCYETALFVSQPPAHHIPIIELIKKHKLALLSSVGIVLFPACLIICALFFPAYLSHYYNYPLQEIYHAMTLSLIWSAIMLLVFGYISDYVGRKGLMLIALSIAIIFLSTLFKLLDQRNLHALLTFMFLYQTLISALVASYPSVLAENFVTKIRFTGIAVSYNLSFIFAAFLPMVLAMLEKSKPGSMPISTVLTAIAIFSMLIIFFHRDRTGKSLI